MRRSELLLAPTFSLRIVVWIVLLIPHSESLRGSAVVLQAKTKITEPKAEEADDENNNGTTITTNSTKSQLTGIPQIDYVLDPNLPRELNGQNLTDYPFYNSVPDEIDFKCDGLHDGFYASVPHKCQVYHHCLFGTRYDFLCANYTAFDQKTFICHFVSEVDCENSPKYYKRNEALYKEATTTTTTTTTTPTPSTTTTIIPQPSANGGMRHGSIGRRRRPYRRRRPMYEYYYDDEYPDTEYYDEDVAAQSHRRTPNRKQNKETYDNQDTEQADYETHLEHIKPSVRTSSGIASSVYDRPRVPPKIRRPVPKNERDKYEYLPKASSSSSTIAPVEKVSSTPGSKSKNGPAPQAPSDDEYYDAEEEEYDYEEPRSMKSKHQMNYDPSSSFEDTHRHVSRHRNRQPIHKRTEMYDDYDMKERSRMNRRKEYTRYDERPRGRPISRNKGRGQGYNYRRRPEKRPILEDDYYYEDEEEIEEEVHPKNNNRRPTKPTGKPKTTTKSPQIKSDRSEVKLGDTTPKYSKLNLSRTSKANLLENETPKDNEIPTTENSSARNMHKHKTIKIVNNALREAENGPDLAPTEETRTASTTHTRPSNVVVKPIIKTELKKSPDDTHNKTVTAVRHFVITTPIRKPSHYAFVNTPLDTKYKDEPSKLPEQQRTQEYYKPPQFVKIHPIPSNQTYQSMNFGNYFIPIEQTSRLKPIEEQGRLKPVEEHISENLNTISNGITYTRGFITEPKTYDTTKPEPYRQDHRLYTNGDRLYTNSITFPQRPPSNYDITAPGPSAPAEILSAPENKYSDLPVYTANTDYDVTYNDALQPSTLHPVRRFPSTSFYVQSHPRRRSSEYAFNDSAFSSLNRSQKRN